MTRFPFFYAVGLTLLLAATSSYAEEATHNAIEADSDLAATLPTPEDVEIEYSKKDYSPEEIKLLQELEERRVAIERREKALELRERLVDLAEKRLVERANNMNTLKDQLEALLKNLSDKEEEELLALAKIYEVMKPSSAASVLNRMDNKIVFDLFKRMKKKSTAKIMEKMNTVKARIISEMLAEKSDLPMFGQQDG